MEQVALELVDREQGEVVAKQVSSVKIHCELTGTEIF